MVIASYTSYPSSDAPRLTREDVDRLLEHPSVETKIDILEKVTRSYQPALLTERELALAEQIFRLLVQDSTVRIRAALAANLKQNSHVPKDIILKLAQDVEPVATPILEMSHVLDEGDLLVIVQHSDEIWRYLSVARREDLPEAVADALVDTGRQDVMATLLDNVHTKLSLETYHKMMDTAVESDVIAMKMARRPTLPLVIVEKLLTVVSTELAKEMHERFQIDDEQAYAHTRMAREMSTLELVEIRDDPNETETLVVQLLREERLTASLIINALCHGNIQFFEMSMAALSSIPLENAQKLIADRGPLGFRALYNKSGLPVTMFKAVRLLLDSVRLSLRDGMSPGGGRFVNHVIEKMLDASYDEPVENLSYILALLRQHARSL